MDINKIVCELKKYSESLCTLYPGVDENEIIELEKKINFKLPKEFKDFLSIINGFEIMSDMVYGIHNNNKGIDLFSNYIFEKDEVGNPIYDYLLPIAPNGRGDHYCLDLKSIDRMGLECHVVFWQHDYEYTYEKLPEIDRNSFTEFIWKILQEVEELIDYDGNDKP